MRDEDDVNGSNRSNNPYFGDIVKVNLMRRRILQGGIGAAAIAFLGGVPSLGGIREASAAPIPARPDFGGIGFDGIPANSLVNFPGGLVDDVALPPGYKYEVLFAWGDPIGAVGLPPGQPAWKSDASNTSDEQALQCGMHHDGMWYFPFPGSPPGLDSRRGLLCLNHEYVDQEILWPDGTAGFDLDKVRKALNAHGVSIIEIRKHPRTGKWEVKRPSPFARRITGQTPMQITGPAAGHPLLQTAADSSGAMVLGTLNNCGSGRTPWDTYVTCEENWNGYFGTTDSAWTPDADQRRYGVSAGGFGYLVEIDPYNPRSTPKKRTAVGRIKHENAEFIVADNGHVVCYTGDDERFDYIYKFVTKGKFNPRNRGANMDLLDEGTLYVAKFTDDATSGDGKGVGEWVPLTPAHPALTGWTQAEICIKTRQAADAVGATRMDRPEWITINPFTKAVYCALTNNSNRGVGSNPAVDEANPRVRNNFGHIIRWYEAGGDHTATTFTWEIFALAGDPARPAATDQGNIVGDIYNSPDCVYYDKAGRLWIQTDATTSASSYAPGGVNYNIGTNQMLCADPLTRETRRFLTAVPGCEVTGVDITPDGKTMFVNLQHPGEGATTANPQLVSAWPDGPGGGRPRSATMVITRDDGGVIGGL
ncbi:MAG TPA: PhoX family phosphatase [Pelomicrobium sp.]|nr:PhoX family phosphatase [Pelomicrobium sp.]